MRSASEVMADLAASGLSTTQIALVMELSATVAAEARPVEDRSAQRRRAKDREYQAEKRHNRKNLPISADALPNDIDILTPPVPSTNSDELASPAGKPELKPEHVVEAWNATAERLGLRAVRKFTPERRRKLMTRIRQNSIEDFTEAIASIERSPFLRGENDRGWRADFDWMLEPKNFTKLTEGTYDR